MIFTILMAAAALVGTGVIATVPALSTLPLGVSVPPARLSDAAVTAAISSYRRQVWALGIVAMLLCLVGPVAAALSSLIVTLGAFVVYQRQRQHIIAAKREGRWFDDVEISIAAQVTSSPARGGADGAAFAGLPTPRFPWLPIVGGTLACAVSVLIVAAGWETIPQTFPTHWGPNMEPDAWSTKGIGTIFTPSFISLGVLALFAAICAFQARASVHARADRSIKGQIRTRATMAASTTGLGWMGFVMALGFALIQVTSALPAYAKWNTVSFVTVLVTSMFGGLLLIALVLHAQGKFEEQLRGVTLPDAGKASPDNDAHYKWGMFYYNPDDPAVMVDKRFGAGVDFNYATWQAKAFMAVALIVLAGSIALPLLLS